jgi:3-hydroxyisobutyrate dehydrogenase
MGSAMARNLVSAGLRTTVWDRSATAASSLSEAGALVKASPAEAARDAHVVITMLPTADVVNSVIFAGGVVEALAEGAVWAQMGTIGLTATTEIGSRLGQLRPDVLFVDAPVSGSKGPAEAGQLLILAIAAAGDDELPLLAALSRQWRAAVDAGHGREDISAARLALGRHRQP